MLKAVTLKASPKLDANGDIEWTLTNGFKKGKKGNFPPIDTDHGEPCEITIKIDNPPGLKIIYDQDPIWIVEGPSYPTQPGIFTDQVNPKKIVRKDTALTFIDENSDPPRTLIYRLNFVDSKTNTKVKELDPEIKNKGGNGIVGPSRALVVGITILAVGLVAIAALAWFRR